MSAGAREQRPKRECHVITDCAQHRRRRPKLLRAHHRAFRRLDGFSPARTGRISLPGPQELQNLQDCARPSSAFTPHCLLYPLTILHVPTRRTLPRTSTPIMPYVMERAADLLLVASAVPRPQHTHVSDGPRASSPALHTESKPAYDAPAPPPKLPSRPPVGPCNGQPSHAVVELRPLSTAGLPPRVSSFESWTTPSV